MEYKTNRIQRSKTITLMVDWVNNRVATGSIDGINFVPDLIKTTCQITRRGAQAIVPAPNADYQMYAFEAPGLFDNEVLGVSNVHTGTGQQVTHSNESRASYQGTYQFNCYDISAGYEPVTQGTGVITMEFIRYA